MPLLTCEFQDGDVREWHATEDGVEQRWTRDYRPVLYVDGPETALGELQSGLHADPKVSDTEFQAWFTDLGDEQRSRVLAVSLDRFDDVRTLSHEIRHQYESQALHPATFELFNVDLASQFRFCVETETPPVPARDLGVVELNIPETALRDGNVTALTLDGEPLGDSPQSVLRTLQDRLAASDPDVLCCLTARLTRSATNRLKKPVLLTFVLGAPPGTTNWLGQAPAKATVKWATRLHGFACRVVQSSTNRIRFS